MTKLNLSLACWNYDRTRAIQDGSVQPDGVNINYHDLPVEETFFRMLRHQEFDIAEMSLSSYTVSLFREPRRFVAIPIFPSRFFRHSCIYVNAKSGIRTPKDLIGKKVGVPEFQMTAPVWIRGTLDELYGVPVDSVTYYTGGEEEPGRSEKLALDLPANIKVQAIPDHKTLSQMLRDGEIDALHTARAPSTYDGKNVVRLFENYGEVEKDYFRKTGLFPIMHTIAIRRDVYEQNRWVAQSLYKAFVEAQKKTYADLRETAVLKAMLPFLNWEVDQTIKEMGTNYWAYGLQENEKVLSTFLKYHYDCGLSKRLLKPEELFAPETHESFKI